MRIHNLYTDANGQSHFRDIDVEWVEETRSGKLSKRLPATGIIFREVPPNYDLDWHPAPRRQYIINLDAGVRYNRERRRNPQDRRRRGIPGRGYDRQGSSVQGDRQQDPQLHFRTHRLEGAPEMKLLYFNDYKLGVLKGDRVVDVSSVVRDIPHTGPGDLINGLIARFDQYRAKLNDATASGQGVALSSVRVRPPLPKPDNIDCMAVNYMEDGTRSAPAPINAFQKTANAICGPGDTMVLPDAPATIFEGEAELALVIGKKASNVKAADAMDYVFGYTCFIDGSARGLPAPGFFAMKSRDTFAPIGPCIVTKDEIPDPQKLQIRLSNNGTLMQNFNTSDMAHKIPRCIEWLSSIHALEPGDIVATGTNHRGLNPFMDGDKIELEIEGIGKLAFNVKDELKRTWERRTRLQMHEQAAQKTAGAYPDITPQLTGKHAPAAR